jgi:C1A family cysteine protease
MAAAMRSHNDFYIGSNNDRLQGVEHHEYRRAVISLSADDSAPTNHAVCVVGFDAADNGGLGVGAND